MLNRFIEKLQRYTPLDRPAIAALEKVIAVLRDVLPSERLIREGDRPGPMLGMLDGWASRYKILRNGSRQIMEFVMSGDACGLRVGLLARMDHSIQTITKSRVSAI